MTAVGLIARCDSLFGRFGPSPLSTAAAVVGTALLALAIGVRTPQRFALWAAQVAWRRFVMRGRSTELSGLRLATRGTDRPLSWLVLSIIALLAGVLTAGVPVAMGWLEGFYEGMLSHFLWSIPPLAVLQAVIVFAAGCIPLGILGMGLSSLHRLSCPC
ncbi:MAG: hypothetical protein ACE5EX_06885, partial [Phycisphaerae bacterium]